MWQHVAQGVLCCIGATQMKVNYGKWSIWPN